MLTRNNLLGSFFAFALLLCLGSVDAECALGKYANQNLCKICPMGKYSDETGISDETDCKLCPAGKFGKGQYWDSVKQRSAECLACTDCSIGLYGEEEGEHSEWVCKQCDIGYYHNEVGKSSKSACKACGQGSGGPGYYYDINKQNKVRGGENPCTLCEFGKYNWDSVGNTECNECSIGKYQNEEGRKSCVECKIGMYANTTGNRFCVSCSL